MTIIYRAETIDNHGPYQGPRARGIRAYDCFNRDRHDNDITHPGPQSDPVLEPHYYNNELDTMHYGFSRIGQLHRWFDIDERRYLQNKGFRLSVYKAQDATDHTFTKTVALLNSVDMGPIVSLGAPYQWYLSDIQTPPSAGDDKLFIDAAGRNHKGSPVWVSYSELITIVNKLEEETN